MNPTSVTDRSMISLIACEVDSDNSEKTTNNILKFESICTKIFERKRQIIHTFDTKMKVIQLAN